MTPSKRDVKKRIEDLEGDSGTLHEEPDLSLSEDEKEVLNEAYDVEPATMRHP